MKHIRWMVLVFSAISIPSASAADKPIAMQAKDMAAEVCAGCHGVDGFSQVDDFPRLAGQRQTYLAKQLKDFRDGRRKDPLMSPMAAPLSDNMIENLALHFSTRKSR